MTSITGVEIHTGLSVCLLVEDQVADRKLSRAIRTEIVIGSDNIDTH